MGISTVMAIVLSFAIVATAVWLINWILRGGTMLKTKTFQWAAIAAVVVTAVVAVTILVLQVM